MSFNDFKPRCEFSITRKVATLERRVLVAVRDVDQVGVFETAPGVAQVTPPAGPGQEALERRPRTPARAPMAPSFTLELDVGRHEPIGAGDQQAAERQAVLGERKVRLARVDVQVGRRCLPELHEDEYRLRDADRVEITRDPQDRGAAVDGLERHDLGTSSDCHPTFIGAPGSDFTNSRCSGALGSW